MNLEREPLVSIIIPTYKSAETLKYVLESIKNQSYKNIEIIVVDKLSRDRTAGIANNYNAKIIQDNGERAKAKNIGLEKARGKYVLFLDSDMQLSRDVAKECVETAEKDDKIAGNDKIGGIIIPERSIGNGFWVRVRDFERSFYAGSEIESARFFRRDLALKVGGFDEDVVFFEESTLPQKIEKLGYNVKARIKAEILHHEIDFSLFKWLKKKYYYGKTAWKYLKRYEQYGSRQMNIIYRFGLFFRNKRFYSNPLLALGVITLKSLEYVSAGTGYIVGRVREMITEKNLKTNIFHTQRELIILNSKLGMLRVLKGIDYYRMIEYPVAYNLLEIENHSGSKVLDIGSLDSIFPLFLASKGNTEVTTIDINPRVKVLERYAKRLGINNLKVEIQDVRCLRYPSNYFDRITAISTIEHILPSKDGDVKAMKEISRVLKPGGIAVITIPYKDKYQETWRFHPIYGKYLMRSYNEKAIMKRLIEPLDLLLKKILYFCEDTNFSKIWYKSLIYICAPLSFIFSNFFIRIHKKPINAKGVVVILKKPKEKILEGYYV